MSDCTVLFAATAIEHCTVEQFEALKHMADSSVRKGIHVMKGGFDLPDGYLTFRYDYKDGGSIYGGIAPNGDVST